MLRACDSLNIASARSRSRNEAHSDFGPLPVFNVFAVSTGIAISTKKTNDSSVDPKQKPFAKQDHLNKVATTSTENFASEQGTFHKCCQAEGTCQRFQHLLLFAMNYQLCT